VPFRLCGCPAGQHRKFDPHSSSQESYGFGRHGEHMALEDQLLPKEKIADQVDKIARELAQDQPSDLWDEK
jgi:hypothetical protein